jgi:Domain of unknown function (DUF4158)
MSGRTLDVLERVLSPLLEHVAKQLDVASPHIATLRALYRRRRATLYEHQSWAIEHLGMMRLEQSDLAKVSIPLGDLVRTGRSTDQLQREARGLLYRRRLVIPGPQRVAALVRLAIGQVESAAMARIERDIPARQRELWREALDRPAGGCPTLIDFIGEAPGKYSPSTLERGGDPTSVADFLRAA